MPFTVRDWFLFHVAAKGWISVPIKSMQYKTKIKNKIEAYIYIDN